MALGLRTAVKTTVTQVVTTSVAKTTGITTGIKTARTIIYTVTTGITKVDLFALIKREATFRKCRRAKKGGTYGIAER